MIRDPRTNKTWIEFLSEEDLAFVKRFILASGSLKAVAREYRISYPTVRLRLDRLIQKIKVTLGMAEEEENKEEAEAEAEAESKE